MEDELLIKIINKRIELNGYFSKTSRMPSRRKVVPEMI
jgi:hypothetical protein